MNVLVTLEHRFERTPDGAMWTQTAFAYPFWLRYLAVFDSVRVMARVRDVPSVPGEWKRADGAGVTFAAVPFYRGPMQYALKATRITRLVRGMVAATDAVILRAPSQIATSLTPSLHSRGHPYALEVVGDPLDVFAPGSMRHPLRSFFRRWFSRQLRIQCQRAGAVSYVTEHALQRRYPTAEPAFSTYYSDVELPETSYADAPRAYHHDKRPWTVITVGSLAQMYKAPDILIRAVAACVQADLDIRLVIVGDGQYRQELETLAAAHGLADRISFRGQIPAGDAVRWELDQADLFVLPSRADGLPRALLEAMARGLPSIGSTVGGIPELLPAGDLVPPGDVDALTTKLKEVLGNPLRMAQMSANNMTEARKYHEEVLKERRMCYYRHVRNMTAVWSAGEVVSRQPQEQGRL